ncbi:MAG: stress protection protein MarC [Proteobacteria bacterium]|nr:MAG: stress protection protein MarC [Pseudomonadota bacterium]QKK12718.1 MAG: MarC family NAAT transporter [Pseudomonadota bacterium]
MGSWITITVITFIGILPIANPFSTAVVFLTITERFSEERRRQQALMACVYMAGILITFLLLGSLIMNFFGISVPGLRIAGGLIVARIGFGMLTSTSENEMPEESRKEVVKMDDVAFTPLAMPMLSGPGSIAVTIGMATDADGVGENLAIVVGIGLVALVSWLVLRASARVVGVLGATGMNAMGRIMGFLLVCIGIQFIVDGTHDFLSSAEFWAPILDAIRG